MGPAEGAEAISNALLSVLRGLSQRPQRLKAFLCSFSFWHCPLDPQLQSVLPLQTVTAEDTDTPHKNAEAISNARLGVLRGLSQRPQRLKAFLCNFSFWDSPRTDMTQFVAPRPILAILPSRKTPELQPKFVAIKKIKALSYCALLPMFPPGLARQMQMFTLTASSRMTSMD